MIRKLLLVALLVTGMCVAAYADETVSRPGIEPGDGAFFGRDGEILVIETTDTFVPAALDMLGEVYDTFSGADFSAVDLSGYDHVFVCMDGGLIEEASIANVAAFANDGGCLHFFGGTCWQPYAQAMDEYLLANNSDDYCWTVSGAPHSTVTDAGHYLAVGLPASYDFLNTSAAYYSLRSTDGAALVAAVNGDGYDHLLSKDIGEGNFDICINSAYFAYWTEPSDWDWGMQVVANMLTCDGPVATENSSWSSIKAQYR